MSTSTEHKPLRATVTAPRRWLRWASPLWLPIALFMPNPAQWLGYEFGFWSALPTIFGVGFSLLCLLAARFLPRRLTGEVGFSDGLLEVDGRRVVPLAQVVDAYTTLGAPTRVRLALNGRPAPAPIDVQLADESDARDFQAAVREHTRTVAASFSGYVNGARMQPVFFVLGVLFTAQLIYARTVGAGSSELGWLSWASAMGFLVVPVLALLLLAQSWRTVTVGADGIRVSPARFPRVARGVGRYAGTAVFYPYDEVRDVSVSGTEITLMLASWKVVTFNVFAQARTVGGSERNAETLRRRIALARAEAANGGLPADLATALAPVGNGAIWRRSLEALVATAGTYRSHAILPERLWRVLEDPTQPPALRAGAAAALRVAVDPTGKERLRVATKSSASDELRRALEAAADDDEAALDGALEALGTRRELPIPGGK